MTSLHSSPHQPPPQMPQHTCACTGLVVTTQPRVLHVLMERAWSELSRKKKRKESSTRSLLPTQPPTAKIEDPPQLHASETSLPLGIKAAMFLTIPSMLQLHSRHLRPTCTFKAPDNQACKSTESNLNVHQGGWKSESVKAHSAAR